jgi:hypothetical protein
MHLYRIGNTIQMLNQNVTIGSYDMSIQIDCMLLNHYPGYDGCVTRDGNTLRIMTGPVTYQVLSTLRKVISDLIVIPTLDLGSHHDVYTLLQITRLIGIPDEKLYSGSFKGWTEHRKWTDLRLPEYMWLVWNMVEELVDFRKHIRLSREPFEMLLRAIEIPEMRKDSNTLFNMMMYFSNFKLETCFDMNNDKVQAQLTRLRADLDRVRPKFLIDPHAHTGFFTAVGCTNSEVWSCNNISVVKKPTAGQSTIVDMDTVMTRFHEFTCDLFKKPLNPKLKDSGATFPWENVAFAGGGATKILSADYEKKNARQSDVDLFIFGETFDDRKKTLDLVLDWFNTFGEERSRTYYAIRGSVITIYIKNVNRKVQIVSSNAKDLYGIIGFFDLTHIQWALWNWRYYGTPNAALAMRSKITRFNNTLSVKAYRMIKAMVNGYDVEKSHEITEKIIDLTSLIEDPKNEQLQSIIRDFHGYYYPTDMSDYEPEEELKHILAMICKDANASMATNDPTYVKQNVVVSGNFNDSYESISFTTFNPALIMNKGQNRRLTQMSLKTKHGVMRLTSNFLTVKRSVTDDEGTKITLKAETEEFPEFTKLLEGNVYRMFRAGGVTKTLFNEGRELLIEIPRYALDAQLARGYSIIRNQRGTPLNIEEDLHAGDKIQFMFIVELTMSDTVRKVILKPIKFIKYAEGGEPVEDNDDIDAEVAAAGVDVEDKEVVEIKYVEY